MSLSSAACHLRWCDSCDCMWLQSPACAPSNPAEKMNCRGGQGPRREPRWLSASKQRDYVIKEKKIENPADIFNSSLGHRTSARFCPCSSCLFFFFSHRLSVSTQPSVGRTPALILFGKIWKRDGRSGFSRSVICSFCEVLLHITPSPLQPPLHPVALDLFSFWHTHTHPHTHALSPSLVLFPTAADMTQRSCRNYSCALLSLSSSCHSQ